MVAAEGVAASVEEQRVGQWVGVLEALVVVAEAVAGSVEERHVGRLGVLGHEEAGGADEAQAQALEHEVRQPAPVAARAALAAEEELLECDGAPRTSSGWDRRLPQSSSTGESRLQTIQPVKDPLHPPHYRHRQGHDFLQAHPQPSSAVGSHPQRAHRVRALPLVHHLRLCLLRLHHLHCLRYLYLLPPLGYFYRQSLLSLVSLPSPLGSGT